jgi:hypothetical protein
MSKEQTVSSTVLATPEDAWGYLYASMTIPGVRVELVTPKDEAERQAAVAEHLSTLVLAEDPWEEDWDGLSEKYGDMLKAAFEDTTHPAVLVRMHTAAGDEGKEKANQLAELATERRAVIDYAEPITGRELRSLLS